MSASDVVFLALAIFAGAYWCVAVAAVRRVRHGRVRAATPLPAVTILKPLCGDDGHLYENLRSFCRQEYPHYEVVCGVHAADDPAAGVARRVAAEVEGPHVRLVIDGHTIGHNLKVSNLANMVRHARFDVLVIADADMRVGPDYLRTVVGALQEPAVGLVTCLYAGVPAGGLATRLGAMFINGWVLPSASLGVMLERLRHAFGATMACRRTTLESVGGLERLADDLADDQRLGWLVAQAGWKVVVAPYLVRNVVSDPSLRVLFFHELRWVRTFGMVRPASYAVSLLTFGIPVSLVWLLTTSQPRLAAGVVALQVLIRCLAHVALHRVIAQPISWAETALVPIRDIMSFALGIVSFAGRDVRWNGRRFRVTAAGHLEPIGRRDPVRQEASAIAAPPLAPRQSRPPSHVA